MLKTSLVTYKDKLEISRDVVVNVLNCVIVVSEFEFQSCYYVHFLINTLEKDLKSRIPSSWGLNRTTSVCLEG